MKLQNSKAMRKNLGRNIVAAAAALMVVESSGAFTFEWGEVKGSFDSSVSLGAGARTESPSASYVSPVYDLGGGGGISGGGNMGQFSGITDQGDINYRRGDLFTGYLKGSHELLLKMPSENLTFMARVNWLRDFVAGHVTGDLSGQDQVASMVGTAPSLRDGLPSEARTDLAFKARLLDLWVSKSFYIGENRARVRFGNQVINWGESIYEIGGINSTNAVDANKAAQPGTQVKELVLPAPMIDVSSELGSGLSVEAYIQFLWNSSYLPPVGSYWSTSTAGVGRSAYGVKKVDAKDTGQWGLALRYTPPDVPMNLGMYVMNYHDKLPQASFDSGGATVLRYAENRKLFGASANFPLGDWAVGTELSFRPNDAVSLNPASGCLAQAGKCWVDEQRWQLHMTGLLALTPSNAATILGLLGADTATFTTEAVAIMYPHLKQSYQGSPISAGGWLWGNEDNDILVSGALNYPGSAAGSKSSGGINIDFNWVYDGSLISGWQVNPGFYVRRGLYGRTPNVSAQFMSGVTSMNFYVNFLQNPQDWSVNLNYTRFVGGESILDNPVKDRDFVGLVVSRNF